MFGRMFIVMYLKYLILEFCGTRFLKKSVKKLCINSFFKHILERMVNLG